jgi:hypothetical protein
MAFESDIELFGIQTLAEQSVKNHKLFDPAKRESFCDLAMFSWRPQNAHGASKTALDEDYFSSWTFNPYFRGATLD